MPVTIYARETGLKVGIKEEQRSTSIFPVVCARRSLGMNGTRKGHFFPIFTRKEIEIKKIRKEIKTIISRLNLWNPGRDISSPIFTRKEIETKRIRKEIKTIILRLNDFLSFLSNI